MLNIYDKHKYLWINKNLEENMLKRKLIMLSILIVLLFAVSTVAAADNATIDDVGVEDSNENTLAVDDSNQAIVQGNASDVGTFQELQNEIDAVENEGTLNLEKNYENTNGSMKFINVAKTMTIDGKGHNVNANHISSVFTTAYGINVTFKNIIFLNGISDDWNYVIGANCISNIINCSFINTEGIAIYSEYDCTVRDCIFINNSQTTSKDDVRLNVDGSAISLAGNSNKTIHNCTFINNSVINYLVDKSSGGGAISCYAGNCSITNCTFIGNKAINNWSYVDHGGGAILIRNVHGLIENCKFINNTNIDENDMGVNYGGAISICSMYTEPCDCIVSKCIFENNSARHGGAIFANWNSEVTLLDCNFTSNQAIGYSNFNGHTDIRDVSSGGAINAYRLTVKKCSFMDNIADGYGSAIFVKGSTSISDSTFHNNLAKAKDKSYDEKTCEEMNYYNYHSNRHFGNSSIFTEITGKGKEPEISIVNCTGLINNSNRFKAKTKFIAPSVSMEYKAGKYIVATLKISSNRILKGFDVSIKFNGKETNLRTNNNGQVKLLVDLVPGTYGATVSYDGNNFFIKSSAKIKVTVKKATPKLSAAKKTYKAKVKTKKYTATLKDNTGKAIKKAKITLKIKGKKAITAKTNSNGKVTFNIKSLNKKGNYKATVTYKGNSFYNKVAKKVKITIK